MPSPKTRAKSDFRFPARSAPYVTAFYMAAIMAGLMSMVITGATYGLVEGYFMHVLKAYGLSMPIAFTCVLFVRPLVIRLVALTVKPKEEQG